MKLIHATSRSKTSTTANFNARSVERAFFMRIFSGNSHHIAYNISQYTPSGHWHTTTMISSVRLDGSTACMVVDGDSFGLNFLFKENLVSENKVKNLLNEAKELTLILYSTKKTLSKKK
ncbi:MAG: hypothetical protein LLF92_10605 [Planctomycetaceae bacterium]|nr:hypothetical protein [Planctomycetaceae bacterium]